MLSQILTFRRSGLDISGGTMNAFTVVFARTIEG